MTAAARLVALCDAFAVMPPGHASLSLFGSEYEEGFRAWGARHGHRIEERPMYSPVQGAWTILTATLSGGWISVHLDVVRGAGQADEGLIAKVQAALDGKQSAAVNGCGRCGSAMITTSAGERCLAACEQPEAAEGSV